MTAAPTELTEQQQAALTDFEKLPAWDAARWVSIDALEFTSWNVNEMDNASFSELVAEVEEGGFDEPIGIIPIKEEPGRYLVPSGEHRARAAIALGMPAIPAVLKLNLTDVDLLEIQQWS
ncbi:MAG TPA: ParB/RepB/Spo0J family partition protein, partial [Thermoleophilia bacterium]|nr:ParB/RepB/Spo0J family partition protein [Thermoleophilia bacterium]